jgi:putative nucleotidyltransferase with HDIG domain
MSDHDRDHEAESDDGDGPNDGTVDGDPDPDYRAQVREAFPELDGSGDHDLREQVGDACELGLTRGGWREVTERPYAWNIAETTNVEHVRGVTRIAVRAAEEGRDFHGADPDLDVVRGACLLHDVGKCYEYVDHVDPDLVDPDPEYATEEIPHSLSGYALAHEVGCPLAVQRAIPHVVGEVPKRTLEAELVKSANSASSNAITQAAMGISLQEWIEEYSQTA